MTGTSTSFYTFRDEFPDAAACLRHIARVRFGPELHCPRCVNDARLSRTGKSRDVLYCPSCKAEFSPTAGTLLGHSRIGIWEWFYCLLLVANQSGGATVDQLCRQLGISRLAAYRALSLIRLHICELAPARLFGGPGEIVQIDETLLPNVRQYGQDGSRGAIVLGMHDKQGVRCWVIPNRTHTTILGQIMPYLVPGSIVVTDAFRSYHRLTKLGFNHVVLNHSKAEWVRDGYSTSRIDSYWTSLKYYMRRRNRSVNYSILPLYLAEHAFRHNAQLAGLCPFRQLINAFPPIDRSLLPAGAKSGAARRQALPAARRELSFG